MNTFSSAALSAALLFVVGCEAAPSAQEPSEARSNPPAAQASSDEAPTITENRNATAETAGDQVAILGVGATPDDLPAGTSAQYGALFLASTEPVPLGKAIEVAQTKGAPAKMRVAASIEKVCMKKGCWFTLNAPEVAIPVRVQMKDYAFFVPRNTAGADAILEGTFKRREIPQDEAQHYADDEAAGTGAPARTIVGPQEAWQFTADAVRITRAS